MTYAEQCDIPELQELLDDIPGCQKAALDRNGKWNLYISDGETSVVDGEIYLREIITPSETQLWGMLPPLVDKEPYADRFLFFANKNGGVSFEKQVWHLAYGYVKEWVFAGKIRQEALLKAVKHERGWK